MSKQNIIKLLKKYRKSSSQERQDNFRAFEEKMIYRTTKTENPTTTRKMVQKVISKSK
ncbi:hypothetical protein KKC88_01235 [Patescibacteria group bacterium]|nr:hypothetical protein [Patescibacteria group bacterium]MBU1672855.1 hypothetical protein [Patescibacteria group bacterium]MBU1963724.1 hypothetical protein [Patescibacteria group bacterium]